MEPRALKGSCESMDQKEKKKKNLPESKGRNKGNIYCSPEIVESFHLRIFKNQAIPRVELELFALFISSDKLHAKK